MTNYYTMLKTFLQENQIIVPSYQYYGGQTGFQDYGIIGCQIKNKIINTWREFFIGVDVNEVEIPAIMPHAILKASGHVDRFTDYVVYDMDGTCHRADHLAKAWFRENNMMDMADQVDSWDQPMLELQINKYVMLNVDYARVQKKNLMIECTAALAPSADSDFLRPELAQGIFVNFRSYQQFFQPGDSGFIPFGIAQVGKSYRKEISPQPFVRLREFTQAEIEYFVDPIAKTHLTYETYANNVSIPILTDAMQEDGITAPLNILLADAVEQRLISHQLMAYFLAKIYLFAKKIGLKEDKIRFRQHQRNEMAHYAIQCWDLECLVNGSWLECVGCADRGCYDLTAHSAKNPNQPLNAKRKLEMPITKTLTTIKPDVPRCSGLYGKLMNEIKTYFRDLDQESATAIREQIKSNPKIYLMINDKKYEFETNMLEIQEKNITLTHEIFTPNVIEPSFGIDRLMYAVLEQNIWFRPEDERRAVLSLPKPLIVYDVAVFPLHKKEAMTVMADEIRSNLVAAGLKCYLDDSGTAIGKRYVRCDEIGVQYVVTVDPGSLTSGMVTVRDRDTMVQIIINSSEILNHLN